MIVPIAARDVAAAAGAVLVLSVVASVVGTVIVPRKTGSRLTRLIASALNSRAGTPWAPCAETTERRAAPASLVGRILEVMKATPAATRRYLPTSPFKPPPAAPPAEQFAVQDLVTHDKYGLGRVIGIEDDTILVIDFGTQKLRITTPCAKLTKL